MTPRSACVTCRPTRRKPVTLMRDRRRADLDTDRALGLAVLRCVEIVGGAASRIPVAIRRRHPNIPWAQIIAMRNRLIHGYDIVDYDIVWSTVSQDLPLLIADLEKILSPGP
jgi:uncharacterized protein with HEPN domain